MHSRTLVSVLAAAGVWAASSTIAGAVDPVKLQWASDHGGPPHPAAIAEVYFAEQVEKRIPGSKVQIFWAKSLYTVPQGVKALTQGNLEVLTGQFGKTSSVEPLANVLLGAGKLTTVGAIDSIDKTKTFEALAAQFDKVHDITIMGAGHLSMYMGAGAVKGRLIGPADFAGKKMRSMGPAENALLAALGANPQAMAFGDVPPALQTGVIDGLLTSLGGFNSTKEQARISPSAVSTALSATITGLGSRTAGGGVCRKSSKTFWPTSSRMTSFRSNGPSTIAMTSAPCRSSRPPTKKRQESMC